MNQKREQEGTRTTMNHQQEGRTMNHKKGNSNKTTTTRTQQQ